MKRILAALTLAAALTAATVAAAAAPPPPRGGFLPMELGEYEGDNFAVKSLAGEVITQTEIVTQTETLLLDDDEIEWSAPLTSSLSFGRYQWCKSETVDGDRETVISTTGTAGALYCLYCGDVYSDVVAMRISAESDNPIQFSWREEEGEDPVFSSPYNPPPFYEWLNYAREEPYCIGWYHELEMGDHISVAEFQVGRESEEQIFMPVIMAQIVGMSFLAVADSTVGVMAIIVYAAGWAIESWTWTPAAFGAIVVFFLVIVLVKKISADSHIKIIRRKN